jgi:hypothetical protein
MATGLVAKDDDNISFPSSGEIGGSVRNPLTFGGDVWPGEAYLLVIVIDVDRDTLDDTVDAILIHIHPTSLRRYSNPQDFAGEYGFGTITARYRVDCGNNFFGEDCSVLCVDSDSAEGHYRCNRQGSRVCLDGYQDPSSNCTQCVPAIGCSPIGGYCSLPGNCICRPGFAGENCTGVIQERPLQCSTPQSTEDASQNSALAAPAAVYVLGGLVGVLVVVVVTVSVVLVVLTICLRRRGKTQGTRDGQSTRGYYMNEGLGPTHSSMNLVTGHDVDVESDSTSRQYATVDSNQRLADMLASQGALSRSNSSNCSTSVTTENDVPSSSLRPNIAYGVEQNRGEGRGYVNGRKAPMRPPPRPPH